MFGSFFFDERQKKYCLRLSYSLRTQYGLLFTIMPETHHCFFAFKREEVGRLRDSERRLSDFMLSFSSPRSQEQEVDTQVEGNLAAEVSLITLDTIELIIQVQSL